MATLDIQPNPALLHDRDAVVTNIASFTDREQRDEIHMVWIQHFNGHLEKATDDWRLVPELIPGLDEPLVEKSYGDSFEDTTGHQSEWGSPPPNQVIAHMNSCWTHRTALGRAAGTVETKNIDFSGRS